MHKIPLILLIALIFGLGAYAAFAWAFPGLLGVASDAVGEPWNRMADVPIQVCRGLATFAGVAAFVVCLGLAVSAALGRPVR